MFYTQWQAFPRLRALTFCFLLVGLSLCRPTHAAPLKTIKLLVQPTGLAHSPVVVAVDRLKKQFPDFTPDFCIVRTSDASALEADTRAAHFRTLPSQADDLDGDGKADEIAFETDWPANQTRVITLQYGDDADIQPLRSTSAPQAYALLSRKYEGLGWENDRIAWRLYNDKRNSIDVYGKNKPGLSLDYFARPGVNYEQDSPFGRDIFWNGPAIGIGSVAAWIDGEVVRVSEVAARQPRVIAAGPVRAIVEVTFTGWKVGGRSVDLTSRLTTWAGQHWFLHEVTATNADGLTLVTGLPVKAQTVLLTPALPLTGAQHRFLATWGTQVQRPAEESDRVNADHLGLAVILSHGPVTAGSGPLTDSRNHLIQISLHRQGNAMAGRFAVAAGWDQEAEDPTSVAANAPDAKLPESARSSEAWRRYVEALSPAVFTTARVDIVPSAASFPAAAPQTKALNPLSRAGILAAMRGACDYQIGRLAGKPSNDWVRSALYPGVLALYQTTHERKYLEATRQWADLSLWTPAPGRPFFADNQCCIQTYAELAMLQKDPAKLAPVLSVYARQMAAPKPGRQEWSWCDALFMAPPGFVRVSAATGDPKYTAFMNSLWWDTTSFLYDKDEHLFYRDASFFRKRTANGNKVFWSRGNGWVMAAIVRVLEYLPVGDPNYARFVTLLREMSAKVASLQGEDGLWRTSLLDPREFPLPETSGTAFYTYALAWGINHHLLDRKTYLPVAQKAWKGLVSKIGTDGRLGCVQGVSNAPGPTRPENTKEYAVGGLLLAGSEMVRLAPPG